MEAKLGGPRSLGNRCPTHKQGQHQYSIQNVRKLSSKCAEWALISVHVHVHAGTRTWRVYTCTCVCLHVHEKF